MVETETTPIKQRMTKGTRRFQRRLAERREKAAQQSSVTEHPLLQLSPNPTTFDVRQKSNDRGGWTPSTSWNRRRSR